jgi:hypothetical protein
MTEISRELIIPVYLNQRVVFDLIAMLQGGISTVTRITSLESNAHSDNQQYGAAFGLSKALSSLLKIDVSGSKNKSNEESQDVQKAEDRVHTPASLFQVLRTNLIENKELAVVDNDYKPKVRDIIEFTAQLRKNPIIQTMDTFVGLMEMAILFTEESSQPYKHKGGKPSKVDTNKLIKKQMEQFLENLKTGDTVDIVSDKLNCGYKVVITLEREFLNEPTMSDLVDGQFNVVGKIIRVIENENDSINLIRKTAISAMPEKLLNETFSHLSALSVDHGFNIPSLELKIKGPVIQVLPIAIFT